eukprot:UN23892
MNNMDFIFFFNHTSAYFLGCNVFFMFDFMRKRCQMKNYSFRLQKAIKNLCEKLF